MRAFQLVESEFLSTVHYLADTWLPARDVVKQALLSRLSIHPSGTIIYFSSSCGPWQTHFFELEKELLHLDENSEDDELYDFRGKPVFIISESKNLRENRSNGFNITAIPCRLDKPFSKR